MDLLWGKISDAYRKVGSGCEYTNLDIGSFTDAERHHGTFPKLKGKGAEAKDLLVCVYHVWVECAKGYKDYDAIEAMLDDLLEFQSIMHTHSGDLFGATGCCQTCDERGAAVPENLPKACV